MCLNNAGVDPLPKITQCNATLKPFLFNKLLPNISMTLCTLKVNIMII